MAGGRAQTARGARSDTLIYDNLMYSRHSHQPGSAPTPTAAQRWLLSASARASSNNNGGCGSKEMVPELTDG